MMRLLMATFLLALACDSGPGEVDWVTAQRGDLVVGVEVSGTLESIDSDDIKPPSIRRQWRFKIAFLAPEGKDVREGQPVAAFDASDLKRQLLTKENELESASKQLEQQLAVVKMNAAARELSLAEARGALRKARLKAETPEDLSKAVELAKFKLDFELAKAKVEHLENKGKDAARKEQAELAVLRDRRKRAEARIAELKANIGKMRVSAPRAGTVVYHTNWRGEKPKVGDNAHRDRVVIEIAGAGGLRGKGVVDEVDLAKVEVGLPVRIRLDAQPDVEYRAELADIGDSIVRKSAENPVKVAKVELELADNDAEIMRPGMRYRGEIEVGRRKDVLLIPAAAVFVTADGPVVYAEGESGAREVQVEIGARNDDQVEVVKGLKAGDRVSLDNLRGAL